MHLYFGIFVVLRGFVDVCRLVCVNPCVCVCICGFLCILYVCLLVNACVTVCVCVYLRFSVIVCVCL